MIPSLKKRKFSKYGIYSYCQAVMAYKSLELLNKTQEKYNQ